MRHLADDSRTILQEQEADAREIGRKDDPPTDDELDEMCEGYRIDQHEHEDHR